MNLINRTFYNLRPWIPRRLQIALRRMVVSYKRKKYNHVWPIDPSAGNPPENWPGWPENKKFAVVLSHDVDTQRGHDKCRQLMSIEKDLGFRSSFNFVPERYKVSQILINEILDNGFGVCVHGLKHDGKLFSSRKEFKKRAVRINHYLEKWGTRGFTSPSTHHKLSWMHALNIDFDTSTFDTDPFEPQPDGIGTIFPIWIQGPSSGNGFIELPYTLPQDFTLFILMKEKSIDIWKKKIAWVAENGGMALLNTHSDYMGFNGDSFSIETYPVEYYISFLKHIKEQYKGKCWHALPKEAASYCLSKIVKERDCFASKN